MIIDGISIIILLCIAGLAVLLYEFWVKNKVSTKGARVYFYFVLIFQLLTFIRFTFLREVHFIGQQIPINLGDYMDVSATTEYTKLATQSILKLIYFAGLFIGLLKLSLGIIRFIRIINRSTAGRNKFERIVSP